ELLPTLTHIRHLLFPSSSETRAVGHRCATPPPGYAKGGDPPEGNPRPLPDESAYQDDLVIPGSSPRWAISRKRIRETPNLRNVPRGRPSIESRSRTRTGDASRGSFCSPTRAASRSSSDALGST